MLDGWQGFCNYSLGFKYKDVNDIGLVMLFNNMYNPLSSE